MTATATINPCDLFQILFHFPISHHHRHYNSLSLLQDSSTPPDWRHKENRTERGGFCFGTSVSSPHSFSSLPSVRLWCDYYTFSGGFNHGPVGPSPRGGPHFNACVLLFPPVYCLAFYSARQSHWHQGPLRITCLRQSDPWTLNQPLYTGIDSRSEIELALTDEDTSDDAENEGTIFLVLIFWWFVDHMCLPLKGFKLIEELGRVTSCLIERCKSLFSVFSTCNFQHVWTPCQHIYRQYTLFKALLSVSLVSFQSWSRRASFLWA